MVNSPEKRGARLKPAVLIIDDSPVNLRTMRVFLESKFEAVPVKSGYEGMNVLAARKIDLILLDIEMPGMSGFDFLQLLKATPQKAGIPVICVTGHDATPEFISLVIRAGAKDYITKPFEPNTLQTKVSKALHISEYLL